MKELVNAFRSPAFPVNPIPFAQALADGVKANGTDWIKSDEAKALLHILNSQSHGQLYIIDSLTEYAHLNAVIEK